MNDHHEDAIGRLAVASSSRLVGAVHGAREGSCLICLGSIHGNEPAGALALARVFKVIDECGLRAKMRGDFIGIIGNRGAIAVGRRFIHHDLNRAWDQERVDEVRQLSGDRGEEIRDEDWEQREIALTIDEVLHNARGMIYFLDLHTTSATSRPFVLIGDSLRNRDFAKHFPIPTILGLEEQIDGSVTEWMHARGAVSLGFESGRHDDSASVNRHEAVMWLALAGAGLIDRNDIPGYESYYRLLAKAAEGLPRFIEVRYRYGITSGCQFRMNPGYENLERVHAGEILAIDRCGRIKAREKGRILLPLYQGEGDDGFFLARDVKPIWLRISRMLRRLRVGRLAPFLPGVHRSRDHADTLIVDSRVARWMASEVFHLLGYRKIRHEGSTLLVSRREHDVG